MLKRLMLLMSCVVMCSTASAHECTNCTKRIPQVENEYVKTWRTIIAPDQPLKMHRHDRGRIVVAFNDGVLTRVEDNGNVTERVYEANKAYWLDADEPGLHACINYGDEPLDVMVIEIKTPEERAAQ